MTSIFQQVKSTVIVVGKISIYLRLWLTHFYLRIGCNCPKLNENKKVINKRNDSTWIVTLTKSFYNYFLVILTDITKTKLIGFVWNETILQVYPIYFWAQSEWYTNKSNLILIRKNGKISSIKSNSSLIYHLLSVTNSDKQVTPVPYVIPVVIRNFQKSWTTLSIWLFQKV